MAGVSAGRQQLLSLSLIGHVWVHGHLGVTSGADLSPNLRSWRYKSFCHRCHSGLWGAARFRVDLPHLLFWCDWLLYGPTDVCPSLPIAGSVSKSVGAGFGKSCPVHPVLPVRVLFVIGHADDWRNSHLLHLLSGSPALHRNGNLIAGIRLSSRVRTSFYPTIRTRLRCLGFECGTATGASGNASAVARIGSHNSVAAQNFRNAVGQVRLITLSRA